MASIPWVEFIATMGDQIGTDGVDSGHCGGETAACRQAGMGMDAGSRFAGKRRGEGFCGC